MGDTPAVSIVLHLGHENHINGFARAMESILGQDFVQWELIIVNALSSRETEALAAPYLPDRRIVHVRTEHLSGPYGAIEEGISVARAPYVTALPGDAFLVAGALRRLYDATLERPDAPVVYGRFSHMSARGEPSSGPRHIGWAPAARALRRSDFADLLRFGNYVNLSAALVRRSLFDLYSLNTIFHLAEYDLFARFARDDVELFFVDELVSMLADEVEQIARGSTLDRNALALRDQVALLECCVVPTNFERLLGYEDDLLALVASRRAAFERHTPFAACITPQMEARIAAIAKRIGQIGDEAARVPRDPFASMPRAACEPSSLALPARPEDRVERSKYLQTPPPAKPTGLAFAGTSLDEVFRVTLSIAESGRIVEAIRYYDEKRRFFPKASAPVERSLFMPLSHLETYDQQIEQLRAFLFSGDRPA